jgi:predicted DNA-binding transcriptional regulator AlpA
MTDDYGFAPTEKMLTPTTLAEMLEISDRHLTDVRREDKTFPTPVLLGTLPRWSPAVIRRWMDRTTASSCTCANLAQAATPAVAATPKGVKRAKGAQRVH